MESLWKIHEKKAPQYPRLEHDLEVDVVVIGGGITGITAATQLIQAGKRVALLEAHHIGGVTTASSTGNLYIPVQPLFQSIITKFNQEVAKTVAYSRQLAINYIEKMIHERAIDCHFKRRPWYAYSTHTVNLTLKKEVDFFKEIGLDIDYTKDLPLDVAFKEAVIMPDQARFNPLQYVVAMAEHLFQQGCQLFEETRVVDIEEDTGCLVRTESGKIKAENVFIATHTPIGINLIQTFTAPYRSYVVAVTLKNGVYPEGHFWDWDNPMHALCTHPISNVEPELLMVAGEHHKTGQKANTKTCYEALTQFLKQRFQVNNVIAQWSAQHYQSADNIPYIGLAHWRAKHTYMATGFFADGLVYGTLAGLIIGDLLANKENALLDTFNATRKDFFKATPFLLKENSNVLLQYLKDLPFIHPSKAPDLKKGEGKIIEIKKEKYAVCCDSNNELHLVSAVCPHMKCLVKWNNAEQTWDCPCHGSRFKSNGEFIEGPATKPLKKFDLNLLKDK